MAGTTYSKFFWSDWASDPGLLISSFPAQALWMRLLCIASESDPVGHVLVGGRKPTTAEIHTLTRCPLDEVEALIKELVENGVCDETRDGILVSRRMVRDGKKQRRNAAGGSNSAAVTPRNKKGNFTGRSNLHRPTAPATISQSPESTIHQPAVSTLPPVKTLDENIRRIDRLGIALGMDLTVHRKGPTLIRELIEFETAGIDLDLDLIPIITERREAGRIPADLGSLNYFRKMATGAKEARELRTQITAARATAPCEPTDREGWKRRFLKWLDTGYWPPKQGARPRSGQCEGPKDLLEPALREWARQGGHPLNAFPADPNGRCWPWENLTSLRDNPDCDYGDGPYPGDNIVPFKAAG